MTDGQTDGKGCIPKTMLGDGMLSVMWTCGQAAKTKNKENRTKTMSEEIGTGSVRESQWTIE